MTFYADLKKAVQDYLMQVPVLGFNSGKYDMNLLKPYLMRVLKDKESELDVKTVIRKGTTYLALVSKRLKFLDISHYLAPGFSYDRYLKAYNCTARKGFFPYEWMDDLDKLEYESLPPYAAFHSTLKGGNISIPEYKYSLDVWRQMNMKTFKDYLVWYNNRDVEPFVEAISKQMAFFASRGIDMFKDGYSIPGLTMRYLFQGLPRGVYFSLFGDANRSLHELIKQNIVGGPAVIFHRYHESDKTYIRQFHVGDQARLCKRVLGFDANALYLYALMKPMPTGRTIVRRRENKFRAERSLKYGYMARQWLEWLMVLDTNVNIVHQFNGAEKIIGDRRLPVDGWDQNTRTVYQFHGCYWHGHECMRGHMRGRERAEAERVSRRRRESTEAGAMYIRRLGFNLVEIWECEWRAIKRTDERAAQVAAYFAQPIPGGFSGLKEDAILKLVEEGTLYGMVQCDIHVPENLREYFAEMQPIFKNTEMKKEHLSPLMRKYAEDHNLLKQPRRCLVGSFYAKGILLSSTLLKWYLHKGLVVTKIYLCIQFTPVRCFEKFGHEVTESRRQGDANPGDHSIMADTMKLLGNSGYGKTITNKDNFTKVSFCYANEASQKINNGHFKSIQTIDENMYEVEEFLRKVIQDLPLHIGFTVYQEAKLHMLKFYYDFIDKFIDRRDFQYCQMDTDSAYMAISAKSLEDVVKEDMREEFYSEWGKWFPAEACELHEADWIKRKVDRTPLPEPPHLCCKQRKEYDKRTPGLFKLEWSGDGIIALCSKSYMCFDNDDETVNKVSTKGLSKRLNSIRKENFMKVLQTTEPVQGINRSFRMHEGGMYTTSQIKNGLSFFYGKRKVMDDSVSTEPTDM